GLAAPHVVTWRDSETGALFAANRWNEEFAERVAFAWLTNAGAFTGDRGEFLGRRGRLELPAALAAAAAPLSGATGAGFDPCAALRTEIELAPGRGTSLLFMLGQGRDEADARRLVGSLSTEVFDDVVGAVRRQWDDVASAMQISTPDSALDILVNRWLPYQT